MLKNKSLIDIFRYFKVPTKNQKKHLINVRKGMYEDKVPMHDFYYSAYESIFTDANYSEFVDGRSMTRKQSIVTLREEKYLCKIRNYGYWTRGLVNLAGKSFMVRGVYNTYDDEKLGSIDTLLGFNRFKEYLEDCRYLVWITPYDELNPSRSSEDNPYVESFYVPLEFLEETYEVAYETIPQWWRCDGSREIIQGHRWEAPITTIGDRSGRFSQVYLDRHTAKCSDCGELFWTRDLRSWTPEGQTEAIQTCHTCLQKRGVRFCIECGCVIESNSLYISHCTACGDSKLQYSMNRDYVNEYHNFDAWKKLTLPNEDRNTTLTFGIELEVDWEDCDCRPSGDTLYDLKSYKCVGDFQTDGSLEGGMEMITHACSHNYHKTHLRGIVDELLINYNDEDYSDNCGVHIHVGRDALDTEQIRRTDYFMHRYQSKISKIARRNSDRWAQYAKCIDNTEWDNFGYSHDGRYEAINFRNDKTIEFRIFAQPEIFRDIMTYLDFVHALCTFNSHTTKSIVTDRATDVWHLFKFYVNEHKNTYEQLHKHRELIIS